MNEKEIKILNSHIEGITKNIKDMHQKINELLLLKQAFKRYIKFLNKK